MNAKFLGEMKADEVVVAASSEIGHSAARTVVPEATAARTAENG